MTHPFEAVRQILTSTLTGWHGAACFRPAAHQPEQLLELYDIEGSPYCRLVRETLTELDLDVLIKPCPKGGTRFRPEAETRGGKAQFPLLFDPNTDTLLHESADIIDYLMTTYGQRDPRGSRGLGRALRLAGGYAATALTLDLGLRALPSRGADLPLELFSFEASPFSKPVRARLCELELAYVLRNTGKGAWSDMGTPLFRDRLFKGPRDTTRNRKRLNTETGRVQVPYLIDANTGTAMFESAQIIRYLDQTYRGKAA